MIGLSMYGRFGIAYKVAQLLDIQGHRPLLLVDGTVPPTEVESLKAAGVDEVFSAGSNLDSIVKYIFAKCAERAKNE